MMQSRSFLYFGAVLALLAAAAGLAQGPKGTAPAGPMLWNVFVADDIDVVSTNTHPGLPSKVFASFTPSGEIRVTQIQAETRYGPNVFADSGYEQCSVPPSILVTNGKTSYTLALTHPPDLSQPLVGSSSDSGPLDLVFPSGNRIEVILLPPAERDFPSHFCRVEGVNIAIQYRTR
jgi:hypothetical protein